MTEPKVVRRLKTMVRIFDRQGVQYEGVLVGLAERCGDGTTDGETFYPTSSPALWTQERFALLGKSVKQVDVAVDYVVWEVTHGDNDQYTTHVYPGDLILFIDGKIVPFIGEQVKHFFSVEKYTVELPVNE